MEELLQLPCWYLYVGIIWSAFQGVRGAIEHNHYHKDWTKPDKWIILFIHDFVFIFVCTMTGFAALFLAYCLFKNSNHLLNLNSGSSAFLIFLILIGVIGVGGQLHYIILLGKVPK